jgi:CMP/dCMP kinase
MIITIGGNPGSGKTISAQNLSKELGWDVIDIGGLRRQAAKEKGLSLEEFNAWSEKNPKEGDKYFDDFVKQEVGKKENCIVVGRLAYYLFPESLKLYLNVSLEEGAQRIFEQKQQENTRNEKIVGSMEEQRKIIADRMRSDSYRYSQLYDTDCYDPENFDLVIDTTNKSIDKVAFMVLEAVRNTFK